jgi:hypothetical protein
VGVPLPRGQAAPGDEWRFRFADDSQAAVQSRVLDRWHDGSVRWLLVDSQVAPTAGRDTEFVLERGRSEVASPAAISVTSDPDSITIATGPSTFIIRVGGSFPFASVENAGRQILIARDTGLLVTDSTGQTRPAEILSVEVEEPGALRTVILIKGRVPAGAGQELSLTARFHFFAGLSTVRALVTLTNPNAAVHPGGFWDLGSAGSVLIKDACLSLALADSPQAHARVSPERGVPAIDIDIDIDAALPFELYQDSSGGEYWQSTNHINRERRIPTSCRGYRQRAGVKETLGSRATPIVALGAPGSAITVAVPRFWENFPQAVEAGDGLLKWRFFPGQFSDLHEIQGGEQKTHECFLDFGGGDCDALEWCRSPSVACVDPAWVFSSDAVPFLAPLGREHAALAGTAVDGPDTFEAKREIIDQYGWRHFGEIYGDHESIRQKQPPIASHYNNQYDPIAGFWLQFLRTADPRWAAMANELASHVIDIDVYHTTKDSSAYNGGLFWHTYHYGDADTATHRTFPASARGKTHGGGPSADHNYTSGLMLTYFLTGSEAAKQVVLGLGQYVINLDDGSRTQFAWLDKGDTGRTIISAPGYYGPGRGPANSVNALLDAFRLSGEPRFLTKAEQLIRRVVHPSEDLRRHELDDPERRWFYTMFLQSLGKYLRLKVELGQLDAAYAYGRDALVHYARWMAEHEYPYLDKPEKLEFPTETWAAQDIRKSDVLHYAAMHAAGEDRARFDERGDFFHRNSVESLERMPTRTLARPVVVLLTSGFLHAWRQGHQDASEPAPAVQVTYPPPQVFVSQRARAIKRAKLLVVAAALGGATLVAAWWFR